ncbi:MAG: hypothetical protein ACKVH0_12380, partial [Alphaproteobacteria bacterium]
AGAIAINTPGETQIYDTNSGRLIATAASDIESGVTAMSFTPDDSRLVVLTRNARLDILNVATGKLAASEALPAAGASLHINAAGTSVLIGGSQDVFRYDIPRETLIPVGNTSLHRTILAAGPHAAVLQSGGVDYRKLWVLDMATGHPRFDLPWRGGAYGVGSRDSIIVEENSSGDLHILDAKTGAEKVQIPGDGGVGGFPVRPLLSNDERGILAMNGGADMARLFDAKSGALLTRVQRRDGFIGEASGTPSLSLVSLRVGLDSHIYDFSDTLDNAQALASKITYRYPKFLALPNHPLMPATECDQQTSNADDPQAVAEGVSYDDLGPEAFLACSGLLQDGKGTPRVAYQFARVNSKLHPDQDADTLDLLKIAAKGGHKIANHALAILYLEGRGGGLKEATSQLREASSQGIGASTVILSKLATRGMIDDNPTALLKGGVDAKQPVAMIEHATQITKGHPTNRDYKEATRLFSDAAKIYA